MNKETIHAYCLKLRGTTYDYKEEWQADRYHIGGKMYGMMGRCNWKTGTYFEM